MGVQDGGQQVFYTTAAGTDSFHVTAPSPYTAQQGGGAVPPGGPALRSIHHHHAGQQPPPQQQTQGPPGPAPTSTPPGAEMNKQGIAHMQGQPQIAQGDAWQLPLNYAVSSNSRPTSTQAYFSGVRGPAPTRLQTHRGQIVNVPTNNVSQPMYSPHVSMQQMPPTMYAPSVSAQMQSQQVVYPGSIAPMFPSQPRHQNHTGSAFYTQPGPQQLIVPGLFTGFAPANTPPGQYYSFTTPVNMRTGTAGAPGVGGPGLSAAATQPVVPGGCPPSGMPQPGQISLSMVSSGGMSIPPIPGDPAGGVGLVAGAPTHQHKMRRKHAIDIVDPKTNKAIALFDENNGNTPPRSGDSSARETPQLNTGPGSLDVVADFAARVAKAASEETSSPPQPIIHSQLQADSEPHIVSVNGPDANSLPEQTISKQKIIPIEETSHWKQNQTSSIGSIASAVDKSDANLVKTDIKIVSHISVKPTSYSVSEQSQHIPVIINKEPQVETQHIPVIINKEPLVESQHIPVMINKEPRVEVLTLQPPTPVVSALTNSPDVDLPHRPSPSKESFPALSKPSIQPGAPPPSSPRRKRADAVDKMGGPNSAEFFPSMSVHATQAVTALPPSSDSKTQKKSASPTVIEETIPLTTPQPPAQQPKEKREEKRDRERSSQGKEVEKGTSRGRDKAHGRESSRGHDKPMQNTEKKSVQPHGQDREKSSQGREKPSAQHSRRETTPAPVVVDEVHDVPPTVSPVLQTVETKQPNGDAVIVDASEGKAIQRSKQKRVAKMKDFNRKGSEKEGSDMDAFVEPPADLPTPPLAPPSPLTASVPPVAAKSPSPTPESLTPPATIVPEEVAKPEPNEVERQVFKVELDLTKEEELETETDKLVAARNEENTKVSAAVRKEEAPPIIENNQPKAVTLKKLLYKEDQWSPSNPDGKKMYDRDFLMQFQKDPQSQKKPDNLPDLEVVKDTQSNRGSRQGESRSLPNRSQQDSFTPTFMRGSSLRGPPVTKRNSQQGNKQKGGGKQNMICVSLVSNQDIKLRESENAWKPGRMKPTQLTEEETKTEELYKKVRSVLNKLTPQKFNTLVSQVKALPINNAERLQGVINIVFEKAVDEPNFSEAYAQMCKVLSDMQVKAEQNDKDDPEFVNFRKLLINRCQKEFEKNSEQELDRERRLKEILECQDAEKKKELQINYEEEERKIRMKSVGNIRFIGELFKLKMLTQNIMHKCIKHLLDEGDEESLECLCKLLTTVGKDLEQRHSLASYFEEMKRRSHMKGQISSRVRFMLQDVIDLRVNKWVSRRDDLIPKTIDQIQKEAEKETLEMHINLNSAPQTPRRQEDRNMYSGDRKKRGGAVTNDEGWTNVTKPTRYAVDTKKFLAAGKDIELNMSLGSRFQFSSWMGGAGTNKAPGTEKKNYAPVHANMYSALDVEEKKAPTSMASSRLPPGKAAAPPGERERPAPFIKSVPDDTRQSSRSSSRDSSARRSEESFRPSPAPSGGAAEDVDQRDGKLPKVTPAPIIPDPSLSHEQIVKKTHFLIDEFLQNINYPEARQTVIETFVEKNLHAFVEESLNYLMEKSSQARQYLGKLMADLLKNCVLKKDHYVKGLLQFLESADEIAIDIPKIWLYVAETIVPLFCGSEFSLHDFLLMGSKANPTKLIPEVFSLLIKEQGHNWVKERWESEGLKWTTYLSPSSVDSFLKEHKLAFLNGSGSAASLGGTPVSLNMDDVHKRLLQFLSNESGPAAPFDQIFAWISVNVDEKVREPQFARVLSSAVFRSAIYKHGNSWKLQDDGLTRNQLLLTKYIDNKEQLELQCLYALQALVHELEHPQGLLCQIFQSLWDENIISSESFITWEKSNDPQEMNGKAVALKSLTTFFTALKEAFEESSCEES